MSDGGWVRRKLTPEESAENTTKPEVVRRKLAPEESTGEAGSPGHDLYAGGAAAHQPTGPITPRGNIKDAVKTWANTAALGAGPVIAGGMGALANSATQGFQDKPTSDIDAYRDVRDDTAKELAQSANTEWGQLAKPLGVVSTPIPMKALGPGATAGQMAAHGAKIGGGAGLISGAASSKGDILKGEWGQIIRDALMQGAPGAAGGALGGLLIGSAQAPLRSTAETQALRAAGLRGGIKNSVKKDLGLSNMDEARKLGREFLDEDLIPPIGSSEAVGKRAEALQGQAGNAKSAVLNEAELSGSKYDFPAGADAARSRLNAESAVATDLSGAKANSFADAFERQGAKTPGSFVGADKAKSDAWKSANFADDAPMAAQLYRKAVGATRDDIERQVAAALGADKAATLNAANKKYGIGADALKLAENAATRDAAKKGITLGDVLAVTGGGTAGGMTGHGLEGAAGGLGAALAVKGFDKFGHSSAARGADWLAKKSVGNAPGLVGGATARALTPKAVDALAPYLDLLKDDKDGR